MCTCFVILSKKTEISSLFHFTFYSWGLNLKADMWQALLMGHFEATNKSVRRLYEQPRQNKEINVEWLRH